VTEWCVSYYATDQYIYLKLLFAKTSSVPFILIKTSKLISKEECYFSFRYFKGSGSYFGNATLYGSKASKVTIQGEIVVAKFLALKGPKGTYSQA